MALINQISEKNALFVITGVFLNCYPYEPGNIAILKIKDIIVVLYGIWLEMMQLIY